MDKIKLLSPVDDVVGVVVAELREAEFPGPSVLTVTAFSRNLLPSDWQFTRALKCSDHKRYGMTTDLNLPPIYARENDTRACDESL
jgi:hypothetical protein